MKKILIVLTFLFLANASAQINIEKSNGTVYGGYTTEFLNGLTFKPAGLLVHNSTIKTLWFWDGSEFVDLLGGTNLSDPEVKLSYERNANTNAFTDAEKSKLSGVSAGAEVNVQSDWNAGSGDAQILNKPIIPPAATYSNIEGVPDDNPSLHDALELKANDNEVVKTDINSELQNLKLAVGDSATIANNPSPNTIWINTESHAPGGDNYVTNGSLSGAGVLSLNMNYGSPIQIPGFNSGGGGGSVSWGGIGGTIGDQTDMMDLFNGKANLSHTHSASDITSGILTIGRIPTGSTSATVSLGNHLHTGVYEPAFSKNTGFNKDFGTTAGTVLQGNWRPTWADITSKPSTFTPSAHTHNASDINAGTLAIGRIPTGTSGTTVSLGNHGHDDLWKRDGSSLATGNWFISQLGAYNFTVDSKVLYKSAYDPSAPAWEVYGTKSEFNDTGLRFNHTPEGGSSITYTLSPTYPPTRSSDLITKGYADANYGGSGTGVGDMLKSVYDTNNNNIVDNSTQLNGQSAAYYLAFGNATGTISNSQIANSAVTQSKLSVTGTATSGKILSTNGSTLQWSDGPTAPLYTVYTANVRTLPSITAVVFENTTPGFTWSKIATGEFRATPTGSYDSTKIWVTAIPVQEGIGEDEEVKVVINASYVQVSNLVDGTASDNSNFSIEIRQY